MSECCSCGGEASPLSGKQSRQRQESRVMGQGGCDGAAWLFSAFIQYVVLRDIGSPLWSTISLASFLVVTVL